MGKRQVRIFQKDISKHLPELLLQPAVQVVLCNNVVITGSLSGDEDLLILEDFRFGKHNFRTDEVIEIIYDVEAAY